MNELNSAEDVALIKSLFGTWTRFVFGTPLMPTAVSFATKRADRWHVFVTFRDHPFAAAYVTTPFTHNPNRPTYVVWHYQDAVHLVAPALARVTAPQFRPEPVRLPDYCKPPNTLPTIQP